MTSNPLPVYRHILRGRAAQLIIQIRDVETRELVLADDLLPFRSIQPLLGSTGKIPARTIIWLTPATGAKMIEQGGGERLPEFPRDPEALKQFQRERRTKIGRSKPAGDQAEARKAESAVAR